MTNDDLLFLLADKHKRSFSYISLFVVSNSVFPVHGTRHSWPSYVQHSLWRVLTFGDIHAFEVNTVQSDAVIAHLANA